MSSETINAGQGTIITVGNGNNTVNVIGGSNDTISIGSGTNNLTVTGGTGDTITAGNGNDTITVTGGSNNIITVGSGNDTLVASGDHNDSINLGMGNDTVYLGADDTVHMGKGSELLVLPPSTPVLAAAPITVTEDQTISLATLGISASLSQFGFGFEDIYGFAAADQIEFTTAQFANFQAVMAAATQVGQNTVITDTAGDTITLENVAKSTLAAKNFVFVNAASLSGNLLVTMSGLPSDLSNFNGGTYNANAGTWTGTAAQFNALTFSAGEETTAQLTVTANDTATGYSISKNIALTVTPPTITIAVTGNPQEGQTLTAHVTVSNGDAFTYQWQSSTDGTHWSNIANATGMSYLVQESDETRQLRVKITLVDDGYSVASAATAAVLDNSSLSLTVSVVGNLPVQQGQTLVASAIPGDADDASAPVTYQWQSSSDGGQTWTNVAATAAGNFANGVPSSFYQLGESDEGKLFRASASFTDDTGQVVSTTSAATVAVADVTPEITVPFSYTVSDLSIVKNGTQIYNNTFSQAPPASTTILSSGVPTDIVFLTLGSTCTESNGQAVMSSTGVAPNGAIPGGVEDYAVLNTNTDPTSNLGLKLNADFTVSSTFGLTSPPTGSYGLELNDGTQTHGVDQLVRMIVTRVNGSPTVELVQRDLTANPQTNNILASYTLTPGDLANNNQIEFQLSHVANSTAITGSFALGNGGVFGTPTTFGPTATIFTNGVDWTRADIGAFTNPGVGLNFGPGQSPREGQTLTASASTNDSDATLHYQWQESSNSTVWSNIGSDSSNYVLQESDEGFSIRVVASTTDPDNSQTATVTSVVTGPVLDALPTVTTPVISGTAREGQTLTASASSGESDDPVTYAWYSSADGYINPIGIGATYVVQEGDETHQIEVKATARNDGGLTVTATSGLTAAVLDALPTVTTPVIGGTAQEGQTLTASASSGQPDNPVTYAWYSSADGYTNSIGTGSTYVVQEGDEGFTIEAKATATNDNSVTATATSAATSAVLDAAPTVTTPMITGTAKEGQTLTASAQSGESDDPVTYAWYSSADNYANPIGTGSTYVVQEGDENNQIEVKATATNDNGVTVTATSALTAAVLDNSSLLLSVSVVANGSVQQGQTLVATATPSDTDDANSTITYQWQSSSDGGQTWNNIAATAAGNFANGVPSSFYQLTEGDEGKVFRATASFTDDTGQVVSTTSAATAMVADVTPEITIPFSYAVDDLSIVKNGTQIYNNDFSVAPPASPTILSSGVPTPIVFITQGSTWTESGGKAIASSTGVAPNPNVSGSTFDLALLNTNTDPASTSGLKEGADFTVSSTFDLVTPPTGSYGMELTDGTPTQAIDQLERLIVQRVGGNAVVELIQANLTTNTQTVLASHTLTAAELFGNNQIEFQFSHAASATAGTGTFELIDNGTVTSTTTFAPQVTIFTTSVNWTRVDIGAFTNPGVGLNVGSGQSPREGQTLTASAATNDSDATLHYQWQKSTDNFQTFTPIGTDSPNYVVQEPDEGFSIRVVASTTDPDNSQSASVTSIVTGPVLDALPTVTTPVISGTAQEGQTLTASASPGQPDNPVTYAWYNSADNYTNPIGTGATYVAQESDENHQIEVKATATNDNGVKASATSAPTPSVIDETSIGLVTVAANTGFSGKPLQGTGSFDRLLGFGDSGIDSGYFYTHTISGNSTVQNQYNSSKAIGGGLPTTPGAAMNSTLLAGDYGLTAIPIGMTGGTNYAASGASAAGNSANPNAPNVVSQINSYLASVGNHADPNALYLISGGGNDAKVAQNLFPNDVNAQLSYLTSDAHALANALITLHADGARYIIISDASDATFENVLWMDLGNAGVPFIAEDTLALIRALASNTNGIDRTYGITNTVQPPAGPFTSTNPYNPANGGATINPIPNLLANSWALYATQTQANPQTYLWADDEHLAAAGQQAQADLAHSLIQNAVPIVGETLFATTSLIGEPDNANTTTVQSQWQRSIDGGHTWTNITGLIGGAAGKSYTVQEADEGAQLRVHTFFTNDTGQTVDAFSPATPAVYQSEPPVVGGATSANVSEGGTVTFGATDATSDSDDVLGSVTITGLPTDLTNFNGGTYTSGTGTWSGTAAQFDALTFTAGEQGTYNLSISATTTGAEAGTTTGSYTLTVNPVPEGPVLGGATSATVNKGGALVTLGATDTAFDTDDALSDVTITGLPHDLTGFSGGTYTAATGSWTGTAGEFNALTFHAGSTTGTFNLAISANTTGPEAETTAGNYTLTVNGGSYYVYTTLNAPGASQTYPFKINDSGQVAGYSYNGGNSYVGFIYGNGSYTTFNAPGAIETLPEAINASGEVAGIAYNGSNDTGFIYSNGSFTVLSPPAGFSGTVALGINDSGQVVGYSYGNTDQGFIYSNGSLATLNVPGSSETIPYAINDSGEVAGYYYNGSTDQGFIDNNGSFTTFNAPGASGTVALAINDSGQVAGYSWNGSTYTGFIYNNGSFTTFNAPGASETFPYAINDSGQVAGYSWNGSTYSGFIYSNGSLTTLNVPGASYTIAQGINASAQIAGYYNDASGVHGFIATDPPASPTTVNTGATVEVDSPSADVVVFAGATGTLQLDQSTSFTGTVAGFAGQDQIDLADIAFSANTTLGYSANADNSAGTLTVSDGTSTANLALLGSYMASSFATTSDGHSGTLVSDVASNQAPTISAPPLPTALPHA